MNEWVSAAIAMGAGLVLGVVAGRVTQQLLGRESRPEAVRSAAAPLGSLVFSALLIAGLVTGLGFVNREARDQIPQDLVAYLPNLLSAAIVLIGANIVAQLVEAALSRTVARLPGPAARNIPTAARGVIFGFGAILAAAQLGVDTTIINIAVAALLFSLGLALALMAGFGSRSVSSEVAAGRALRRMIAPGDHLTLYDPEGTVPALEGTVARIQSVGVELEREVGTLLVPHSHILAGHLAIRRGGASAGEGTHPG